MSPKLPWFKFSPARWMGDTELSKCSPATRGVWMDLLCAMHQSGRSGELSGTTDQIARLGRCSTAELTQALTELQTTGTADVTFRNNNVTVINRLMKREAKSRQGAALRVARHRSNAACNAEETEENKENKNKESKEDKSASAPPSFKKWSEKEFYDQIAEFKDQYPKDMLREFYDYWREPDQAGKMRFQLQKTWGTGGRLSTWKRRNDQWGKGVQVFPPKNNAPAPNSTREERDAQLLKTIG